MRNFIERIKIGLEIGRVKETIREAEKEGLERIKNIAESRLEELLNENEKK